jgi:D-alanyl-lipoteichoic acid acyltransferase DltB (MBOAT superfamily)
MQNLFLVIASYVFYGWWDWRFLLLIAFTSLCSYASGIIIGHQFLTQSGGGKIIAVSNIVINLFILCIFKYFNFFMENFEALFRSLGYQMDMITLDIILPVGISFYTFQALSYTIDVYRRKIQPTHDIIEFFAYISFFPQLVAGPIERATNLLPQFQNKRQFDYEKSVDGMRQMLWGFFKKLVVADNCAYAVNNFWDSYDLLPGFSILLIGVLFSFQIYCDFSGYSDIAIGTARLFGINLMRNFNYPYFSRSIPEFWRRWHISLMTWFRDYIYFPLGGSRCARWKLIRNTIIVFLISGLWHGANWTFICWGLYHACLIALFIMLGINTKPKEDLVVGKRFSSIKDILMMIITFLLVMFGWMIFRAESMTQFQDIIRALFANEFFDSSQIYGKTFLLNVIVLLFIEWLQRNKQHTLQLPNNWLFQHQSARWALYVMFYLYIITATGYSQTFLYFQF